MDDIKNELDIMKQFFDKRDKEIKKAIRDGKKAGEKLHKLDKNRQRVSSYIASMLKTLSDLDVDPDCAKLTLEWVFEKYCGWQVEEYIPVFREIHEKLSDLGATYKNRLVWGDADCGAWIEPHENKLIVCVDVYCAARDDCIYIFILDDSTSGMNCFTKFHARTCYKREKKSKYDFETWPEHSSIKTYRKKDWEPQYEDFRDDGYVFSFTRFMEPKVEGAFHHYNDIYYGLFYIRAIMSGIEDPLELPKKGK